MTGNKNIEDLTYEEHLAHDAAANAHLNNVQAHWLHGVFEDEPTYIFFADNHPYNETARRPRDHEQLDAAMAARGCALVATASYPPKGEPDAGYSVVRVYKVPDGDDELEHAAAMVGIHREIFVNGLGARNMNPTLN